MTTGLFATLPLAIGHELHLELGRTRAVVLALLATLCIASVATGAASLNRFLAPAAAHSAPFVRSAPLAHVVAPDGFAATRAAPLANRDVSPEIEAVSALVAKKYRIAPEATRGLIATSYREAQRIGLDPLLIIAVIAVESRFNPIAESGSGAQGLMQVIPGFHKDKIDTSRADSVLDPHSNIRLGARVLKDYIRRGGTETAGLQLYNGSSDDATNAYANKVLVEKQRLQQLVQRIRGGTRA